MRFVAPFTSTIQVRYRHIAMKTSETQLFRLARFLIVPLIGLLAPAISFAVVAAPFAGSYTETSLGLVPGVPTPYGGLTLLAGNTNSLLIGGAANGGAGAIYSVGVTRDGGGHITGFSGSATLFSTAPNIDGGLSYGPGGVLFFTGFPVNTLGQIKSGSSAPDKTVNLTPLGVASSVGGLVFAPNGDLKLLSYNANTWYTAGLSPDGSGTFNVTGATQNVVLSGGLEGAAYVPAGSALFAPGSVLVSEFIAGTVATYQTDANFNPIAATRQNFITGLTGAEGAFIDPVTGDFLFSTFGGGNQVVRISGGFVAPPTGNVPDEASTFALLGFALAAMVAFRRYAARR